MSLSQFITMGQLVSILLAIAVLLAFVVHYLSKNWRHHNHQ